MKVYVSITFSFPGASSSTTAIVAVESESENTSVVYKEAYDKLCRELTKRDLSPRLIRVSDWRYLGTNIMMIR